MAEKTKYVCSECGYETVKWLGKCPACLNWNTFEEEAETTPSRYDIAGSANSFQTSSKPVKLSEISTAEEGRMKTNIGELDRVLGGGIVKGSLVLVGGDPGIGKSTLLLQICNKLSADSSVLYVSGEESLQQIKIRASRLGIDADRLLIMSETNLDVILKTASALNPSVMIIDSIQTIFRNEIASAPGSIGQVQGFG